MPVIESMELAQVLAEAEDISRNVHQKLTSAHLLLAFFTVPNRAEMLLRERGVDEDRILLCMTGAPEEPDGVERDLRARARDVAAGLGVDEADCLHLLIAMTRVRSSAAHQLLSACGLHVSALRNVALSYFTAGMPRRLQRVPQPATRAPADAPPPPRAPRGPPAPSREAAEPPERADSEPDLDLDMAELDLSPRPAPRPTAAAPAARPRSAHALDPAEFPWLAQLGRNLSEAAAQGRLDPLVGREREVEETLDVLGKRRTNNPLLVGEPGVGKTAIVEGVAQRLVAQGSKRVVVELDMASVLAGTQLRGSFSEKLRGIQDEVRRAQGRVVVFIDEVHTVVGAGSTGEGPQDAANELKAALARGEFPCIGATTHEEYRKHIERDPALERRFTPVLVREPSVKDTVEILRGLVARYEQHHSVRYAPEALEAAATLSARYIRDRFLPDKAVAAIDLAGSRARRQGEGGVAVAEVARVVAQMAGIPESRLLADDRERLLGLEQALAARIVGHADSILRVARVLRRNYAGFSSRRPMGSFLFLGPTGVGKTELARSIADALFGSDQALVRLDMSECSEATGVSRLVGAAPGYVGYGEGGQLTDAVRRRPATVVVLDEIDKAHRDVLMLLLQVLEEGRLTDGRGRQVDFSSTVVVLTTNLGGAEATRTATGVVGFGASAAAGSAEERAMAAARAALPPELWNRLDERLVFPALSRGEVARVAELLLRQSSERLSAERRIRFRAGDDVVEHLLDHGGFDPALGARPVRGALQRIVEAPLAERILAREFGPGDLVEVSVDGAEIRFRKAE
ncbi:MAG TPA: ATP-dependent Clp protease ATP-binding subunit [Anaeromyxobacteraceae bacterium]|nr:ATP-dependent Clp protease ATP-binding subunit [Anaeromyxobacteraceae bacterium]